MDLQKLKKFNLLYFSLIHIFSLFAIYKIYTNECNIYLYIFNILLYLIATVTLTFLNIYQRINDKRSYDS